MKTGAGQVFLVALLLLTTVVQYGRGSLAVRGTPPLYVDNVDGIWVELGEGFPQPGVYHFIDGTTPRCVIKMTIEGLPNSVAPSPSGEGPLGSGEYLSVTIKDSEIIEISRKWMNAGRRMVLGVPLGLETMSLEDWQELPGIGPALASRIEADRQKNGEFSGLQDLKRVRGIGPVRLSRLEDFF